MADIVTFSLWLVLLQLLLGFCDFEKIRFFDKVAYLLNFKNFLPLVLPNFVERAKFDTNQALVIFIIITASFSEQLALF